MYHVQLKLIDNHVAEANSAIDEETSPTCCVVTMSNSQCGAVRSSAPSLSRCPHHASSDANGRTAADTRAHGPALCQVIKRRRPRVHSGITGHADTHTPWGAQAGVAHHGGQAAGERARVSADVHRFPIDVAAVAQQLRVQVDAAADQPADDRLWQVAVDFDKADRIATGQRVAVLGERVEREVDVVEGVGGVVVL